MPNSDEWNGYGGQDDHADFHIMPVEPQPTQAVDPKRVKPGEPQRTQAVDPQRTQAVDPQRTQAAEPQPTQAVNPQRAPQQAAPAAGGFVPASAQGGRRQHPAQGQAQGAYNPYNQYARGNASYSSKQGGGMSRGKKAVVAIVIIALVGIIAGLGAYIYKETQKEAVNADLHKLSDEAMSAIDTELTGMTSFEEPFTVLLLGSDARADDPDMGARTDTIILVRVDPLTNTICMMSIPRDTMVYVDGAGMQKINAAYYYGGPSGTIAAVKNLTGVDIDHYAEINFEGLVDLIDAIGGIDVHVDEYIDDPDAGDIYIPEGDQHLDGASALVFSRSRAYADGDYTRQKNQRKVIDAIIHKGLEAPATELTGLIQASTKFLTTDSAMDFDFIYKLAEQIRHNNDYPVTIYSANIPSAPAYVGDVSYVIADTAGIAEMVQIFLACGDISQTISASSISSDIANAGGSYSPTGGTYYEEEYYYDDTYYEETYYEETYVEEAPAEDGGGEGEGDGGEG